MAFDKLKRLSLLLLFLLSLTISCGNDDAVVDEAFIDKSFLEKEPCAPPCWYGLELEKSTKEDVYNVLKQLPFVKQDSIVEKGTWWINDDNATSISYQCLHQKNATCGEVVISKDKVVEIGRNINYDLELSLVVSEIGEPDYITYYSPPHYTGCRISLGWPQKQISIFSYSGEKCPTPGTKINPDSKVTYLLYTTYERFSLVGEENKYPWPGFSQP